jgi:hypothetical protein
MVEHEVIKFDVTEAAIARMKDLYMDLVVKDIDDQEGFDAVHDARMVIVKHRTGVEKHRKFLKADALAYGKKIDTAAKEIFGKLAPIETHLAEQEKIVTDEKKRVKEEEARLFKEKADSRHAQLTMIGVSVSYQEVSMWSDEEFETRLDAELAAQMAERARLEAAKRIEDERIAEEKRIEAEDVALIKAEMEAERKRLADEREAQEEAQAKVKAEQDRIAEEQAKAQAEIDAQKKVIQDKKDFLEREAFEIRAKEEAQIKARIDVLARDERLEKERVEQEAAEAAEAKRVNDLKPDRTKALDWVDLAKRTPDYPNVHPDILEILDGAQSNIEAVLSAAEEKIQNFCDPHNTITRG